MSICKQNSQLDKKQSFHVICKQNSRDLKETAFSCLFASIPACLGNKQPFYVYLQAKQPAWKETVILCNLLP